MSPDDITALLNSWTRGAPEAVDVLIPLIYQDLRRLAAAQLQRERSGHTLQPTALVHEAFLRLANQRCEWHDRRHFFTIAGRAMRRILVDYARRRRSPKRGGGARHVPLEEIASPADPSDEVLSVDRALSRLAEENQEQARTVELRYFAGLTVEETAVVLGVTGRTVKRRWRAAKSWLRKELKEEAPLGG